MRIQFISHSIENVPTAKGSYNKMMVTFKNLESNKVEVKQIMDFASADVYKRLETAEKNDLFVIDLEKKPGKDGKSYWTWVGIHRDDGTAPAPVETPVAAAGNTVKGSTWDEKNKLDRDRFEFDKEKQALIIRQSCLSSAVDLMKDHGKQPDVQAVLEVAKQFEVWVWARGVDGLSEDIPV